MMQEEIFDSRDRTYSAWHRRYSTRRFVGIETAQTLAMIDLDASLYVEYDDNTKEPLALIETAMDRGQPFKPFTVTRNLARRCSPVLPAFVLLYKISNRPNPAAPKYRDIESFRVKRIWPHPMENWIKISPERWAKILVNMRKKSASLLDEEFEALNGYNQAVAEEIPF